MPMTSQQRSNHGGRGPRWPLPPAPVRVVGYVAAAWCVGFAGVSGWQVAAGPIGRPAQRYAAYTSGLAVMIVLVGVLKLAGAAVALAAVLARPGWPRRWLQLLGVALWGAFGLLGLYSAGNLAITVGTVSGLLAPSAAWTAAGGVTAKAIGYVLFFLGGAALFGVLAVCSIGAITWGGPRRSPGWPERRCCWRCSWPSLPRSSASGAVAAADRAEAGGRPSVGDRPSGGGQRHLGLCAGGGRGRRRGGRARP